MLEQMISRKVIINIGLQINRFENVEAVSAVARIIGTQNMIFISHV